MIRVLVVDDEANYCYFLRRLLGDLGCEVEAATRCRDALELCHTFRPEILVADWVLGPPMNGLELLEAARAEIPALHGIMITGHSAAMLERAATGLDVVAVLQKPFEITALFDAIQQAVQPRV